MRHLLFLTCLIGVFFAFDAVHFNGQYRRALWQDVMRQGYSINREIEYRLRRALW